MGLYLIDCKQCGKPFQWFSGNLDQRCSECLKAVAETAKDARDNCPKKDAEIAALKSRLDALTCSEEKQLERDAWMETARQHCRNEEYFRTDRDRLEFALKDARETLALISEGEGSDESVYMAMGKAAIEKIDRVLAREASDE